MKAFAFPSIPRAGLAAWLTACSGGGAELARPDAGRDGPPPTGCGNEACDYPTDCDRCPHECPDLCEKTPDASPGCQGVLCDSACEPSVDCQCCPQDCTPDDCQATCGNDECEYPDDCAACPEECREDVCEAVCGDGTCLPAIECRTCTEDCEPLECPTCANGACEVVTDCHYCPEECPGRCTDADAGAPDAGVDATPDAGPPPPPCEDVIAEFALDETDGTTVADGSANGWVGYLQGGEGSYTLGLPAPDGFGSGVGFEDGWVEVAGLEEIPPAFTVEALIHPVRFHDGAYLSWRHGSPANGNGLVLSVREGVPYAHFCVGADSECLGVFERAGPIPIEYETFTHVAFVRDGTVARLYVGGALAVEFALLDDRPTHVLPLRFGSLARDGFEGGIAWLRVRGCAAGDATGIDVPASQ